ACLFEHLGQYLGVPDHRHEIGVTTPAGNDVLVQMGCDPRPGHATEIHADVEPLGVVGLGEGANGGLGHGGTFDGLLLVQGSVLVHVAVGTHQQVAAVVGVEVEHRISGLAPAHHEPFGIGQFGGPAERTVVLGPQTTWFALTLDVGHAVRCPQAVPTVRG